MKKTHIMGLFVKMIGAAAVALVFSSCEKEGLCDLYTIATVQCTPDSIDVTARRKADYKIDSETCQEMAARMVADRKDDGTFYWKGHPVAIEDLIYCDCK